MAPAQQRPQHRLKLLSLTITGEYAWMRRVKPAVVGRSGLPYGYSTYLPAPPPVPPAAVCRRGLNFIQAGVTVSNLHR
jgi:hypothetical protein